MEDNKKSSTLSRKKQNLENERKKRNRRMLSKSITGLVVLLIIAAIGWVVWDISASRFIVTVNGTRVHSNEFHFHANLLGANPQDPAVHDMIMEELVLVETILHQAQLAGISVSAEDRQALYDSSPSWWWVPEGVSTSRAVEIVSVWDFLEPALFEHHVQEVTLNPDDHTAEFDAYMAENRESYELFATEAQFIIHSDRQVLEAAKTRFDAGDYASFEDLAREYCEMQNPPAPEAIDPLADGGGGADAASEDAVEVIIHTVQVNAITNSFIDAAYFDSVHALQPGQTSAVIQTTEEDFILIYMLDRQGVDMDELMELFMENLAVQRRQEQYIELRSSWIENADVTINQRALNSL